MNDLDLERLGDVWRQPPDPAEQAELQRAAEAVRHRARWGQRADTIAAVAVSGVIALLVLRNPQIDTLLVGGGAILFLLISQIRQRRLRAAELRSLTGTTEEMLDQSIERVTATLKRILFTLTMAAPTFLIGLLVAHVSDDRAGGDLSSRIAAQPGLGTAIMVAAGLALAALAAHLVRSLRKGRRELEQLTALREAYRLEQRSSTEE